ncbi:MAG: GIY-YIG nuclease family protein [Burkholderiales bacterium]|nr:GIY-YIG nuclease family protein [Burkholderiales bacterium]
MSANQEAARSPRESGGVHVRGWVYVIVNKAMPGVVKVGHSMKDPVLRARELGGTGIPHPFEVAFDDVVEDPRRIELQAHSVLEECRESANREWFRCGVGEAVAALCSVSGRAVPPRFEQRAAEPVSTEAAPELPSREERPRHEPPSQPAQPQSAPPPKPAPPPRPSPTTISSTTTFQGECPSCKRDFKVTLTRYDSGAHCPACFRYVDLAAYLMGRVSG